MSHTMTTGDGITLTRERLPSSEPRWDYRISVLHAATGTHIEEFVSGGHEIATAVERRLLCEITERLQLDDPQEALAEAEDWARSALPEEDYRE